MGFIKRNEEFICGHCGFAVPPADRTCRNHCPKCLWSRHVDGDKPGDRSSPCQGMMRPIGLEQGGKSGYLIVHRCQACRKVRRNRIMVDDDWDQLMDL